jgi:hypothetical protein
MILFCLMWASIAQSACHEVVDQSDEYPDPRALEIDSLCIDEKDHVVLFKKNKKIYHFQSILEARNVGYRCTRTGRAESSRCGYNDGDLFLAYSDHRVIFNTNVHKIEGINSGAQIIKYNGRLYKFWVKGRR